MRHTVYDEDFILKNGRNIENVLKNYVKISKKTPNGGKKVDLEASNKTKFTSFKSK